MATTLLTTALLAQAARPGPGSPLATRSLDTRECVNGKWHHTTYKTVGVQDNVVIDLDTMDHLEAVTCDLDGSKLQLKFTSEIYAAEWLVRFHDWNDHFVVGGSKWNCMLKQSNRTGLILRRIVDTSEAGQYLNVRASMARYDEIYEDADISFATEGSCTTADSTADKQICVGYNTACNGQATSPISIYSNKFVNLACSECFVDFQADVFIEVHIRGWQVQNLSAGFRDMAVNASAVLDANFAANWGTGIDKVLPVLQNEYLINFKVGPVPFMVFFDLPVELKADIQFQSQAEAKAGVQYNVGFGNAFVSWNPESHWTQSTPQVTTSTTPVFMTSASFDATGTVSLIPTFTTHFDHILSYALQATPELNMEIQGSEASKQVCLSATFDVDVTSTTTLDINIPWANIAKDWTWNKNIYSSGTKPLTQKCISL